MMCTSDLMKGASNLKRLIATAWGSPCCLVLSLPVSSFPSGSAVSAAGWKTPFVRLSSPFQWTLKWFLSLTPLVFALCQVPMRAKTGNGVVKENKTGQASWEWGQPRGRISSGSLGLGVPSEDWQRYRLMGDLEKECYSVNSFYKLYLSGRRCLKQSSGSSFSCHQSSCCFSW